MALKPTKKCSRKDAHYLQYICELWWKMPCPHFFNIEKRQLEAVPQYHLLSEYFNLSNQITGVGEITTNGDVVALCVCILESFSSSYLFFCDMKAAFVFCISRPRWLSTYIDFHIWIIIHRRTLLLSQFLVYMCTRFTPSSNISNGCSQHLFLSFRSFPFNSIDRFNESCNLSFLQVKYGTRPVWTTLRNNLSRIIQSDTRSFTIIELDIHNSNFLSIYNNLQHFSLIDKSEAATNFVHG